MSNSASSSNVLLNSVQNCIQIIFMSLFVLVSESFFFHSVLFRSRGAFLYSFDRLSQLMVALIHHRHISAYGSEVVVTLANISNHTNAFVNPLCVNGS